MILVFSIVADLWCGWCWFSWSLLTLLTFGADDDGGRLLLLVFSARAANFTTRLFLIMPGGHKLLMVGHLVNHRGIPVILVMSVILWQEKTKIQKILGCGNYDVAGNIRHTIYGLAIYNWGISDIDIFMLSLFLLIFTSTEERGHRTLWVGRSSTLWQGKYLVSSRDAAWYGPTN